MRSVAVHLSRGAHPRRGRTGAISRTREPFARSAAKARNFFDTIARRERKDGTRPEDKNIAGLHRLSLACPFRVFAPFALSRQDFSGFRWNSHFLRGSYGIADPSIVAPAGSGESVST